MLTLSGYGEPVAVVRRIFTHVAKWQFSIVIVPVGSTMSTVSIG